MTDAPAVPFSYFVGSLRAAQLANVFISHSSADKTWAEKIYQWLSEDRHQVFLDSDPHDGIPVGDDWEPKLYERLRWADAVICVVTPSYLESVWCAAEIGAARALGSELLPVRATAEPVEHRLLRFKQAVDVARDPVEARERLQSRLSVVDGGGGRGWPDDKSPYPGLRPFELGEHRVFFGRSREITEIAELLRSPAERAARAILAVVGPSGCGKSSLVRAGVLPRVAGEDYWLPLPPVLPGTDPVGSLARALAAVAHEQRIEFDVTSLRKDLGRDGLKAVATDLLLAAAADSQRKLLIVIDQFEELLTQTKPDERREFVAALEPALGGPVQVLATLRPEFLDALVTDPELAKLKLWLHQVLPLESDALRSVIEEPAKVAGLTFEPGLVTRLVTDTGSGDALPLLAFTLEQLSHDLKRGGQLSLQRYDDIGGVQGALQRQADAALQDACTNTGVTRDQVISTLLNLVTIDQHGRPTKRREAFDTMTGPSADMLEPFVNRRLLSTEAQGERTFVAVSHDAFLVNWPPLKKEIDAQIAALRARRVVENAANDWVASGRDNRELLQGGQLAKAAVDTGAELEPVKSNEPAPAPQRRVRSPRWWPGKRQLATRVEFNDIGREFLEASIRADRKRRRRRAMLVTAVIAILALIATLAGAGFVQARRAEKEAVAQKLIAQSRDMLLNGADTQHLQLLLAGRRLTTQHDDTQFYPMLVSSAGTRKIIENPPGPNDKGLLPVQSVAVSPDGGRIASGSNHQTVRVWDANTGSRLHEFHVGDTGSVWSVAFSPAPNGDRIAAGGQQGEDDGTVQVFDVQSGNQVWAKPIPHAKMVNSVAFSRDGRWIATGSGDGAVRVWDAADGTKKVEMRPAGATLVRSVAFSPAEDLVASGGDDSTVRLWDMNGQLVAQSPMITPVMSVAFSRKGDRLVVGWLDGTVEVLDGKSLQPQGDPFRAHPNTVRSVAFSPDPDGTRIVSGGDDNTVKVWDASSHQPNGNPLRGHRGTVSSVAFTTDGTRIMSGSFDGSVRVWDAVLGLPIPAGQGDEIRAVAFSPDKSRMVMASGGSDGTVKLWDAKTAAQIARLGEPSKDTNRAINGLAFDRDGGRIATAATDGRVSLWNVKDRRVVELPMIDPPVGEPRLPNPRVQSVAFNKDGTQIVAGGFDGMVRLWDAKSLKPLGAMSAHKVVDGQTVPYQVWSVAFSPDGRRVVSGSGFDTYNNQVGQNNLVQLWNVDPLAADGPPMEIEEIKQESNVYAVGFNHDGSQIVSGSTDGTARVWDVATRKESRGPLIGDQNPIYSVVFAHDHQWIAAGTAGATVRLWDIVHRPPEGTALEGHQNWVHSVAFSPDDSLIVSGSADGNLRLWPALQDVGKDVCSKLTTNMSDKQWRDWVSSKEDYRAQLCDGLPPSAA